MAHGRFDKPPETMQRSANGDSVEACGPLLWDGDEPHDRPASAVTIKRVEIKQGNARASHDPNTALNRGPQEWMVANIPAAGSERFEDGHAQAEAEVEVVLEDGSTDTEHWRERVKLSAGGDGSD